MEKPLYIGIILIIIAIALFVISQYNSTSAKFYESKVSPSVVSIELAPLEFKDNKLYVHIEVNTHSVKLDDINLSKSVTLYYDSISLKPISFPKLSGHHSSGVLVFSTDKEMRNFRIIIRNIPDIEERVFEWK